MKRSNRGVALLLVLASLALLSGLVVEFAYNAHVTYNLAFNQKERTQAFFLAQSAIQFSRLILSYDKEARKLTEQASKKLGKDVQIQPLYEMIPVNSALLRGLSGLGEETAEGGEGAEKPEGEAEGGEVAEGEKPSEGEETDVQKEAINVFNMKEAESFLAFEGDFASEIQEEDTKINVNAFFNLAPTQREFDRLKSTVYHLLLTEEFQDLFDDRFQGAKQLAQNIADYVDRDESVHEAGEERGREGVGGGQSVQMKNGKLLTLEELIMVPGMNDAILQKLKPYLTIYGKDEKIFLCRAAEPVVTAAILAYTENNTKMEPLKDDNTELVTKAREAVLNSCPDTVAMANELDKVLGVETPETDSSSAETQPASVLRGRTSRGTTPAGGTGATAFSLENMVKKQADIFRITGIGTVGDTEVRLKTVLDISGGSSKSWKELYWRVE